MAGASRGHLAVQGSAATEGYSLKGKNVWVAGHNGMVGAAVVRRLTRENCRVLTVSRSEVDLCRQSAVEEWVAAHSPQAVILAAATVGGIHANDSRPAEFIYDNLAIAANIIHASYTFGVEKVLYLGSSCIYPRLAPQPMSEEDLLTGPLESTNQWYALAKIAGLKMCQAYRRQYDCDFISAMPTNLYGPNDNFDLLSGHVLPALISKTHAAKLNNDATVTVWGSGTPRRELMYVDDLADALLFLLKSYSGEQQVNIGVGEDLPIFELATLIKNIVGFRGEIVLDRSKPDGPPRKLMNSAHLLAMGWRPTTTLEDGIRETYDWFRARQTWVADRGR